MHWSDLSDDSHRVLQDVPPLDRSFFRDELLSLKTTTTKVDAARRLPPLSMAKLLREKRLKNKLPAAIHPALQGVPLSWNHTYNAPENYSFN